MGKLKGRILRTGRHKHLGGGGYNGAESKTKENKNRHHSGDVNRNRSGGE